MVRGEGEVCGLEEVVVGNGGGGGGENSEIGATAALGGAMRVAQVALVARFGAFPSFGFSTSPVR